MIEKRRRRFTNTLLVFCFLLSLSSSIISETPIVLWHGMGDSCCFPFSMGKISNLIREQISPDVYIHSVRIGHNIEEDVLNSYFYNVNNQIDEVCEQLKSDEKLKNGFHAVGFSQGSQFLRAYVQRCNDPPVRNLISIGGQHQGVFGLPKCPGVEWTICEYIRKLLDVGVYWTYVQNHLVQAQYWHDPLNEKHYIEGCQFLPDINNEKNHSKSEQYKRHLQSLENFVLVKFLNDSMVQPRESSWFGYYESGQDQKVIPLRETLLYKEDRLGLKYLDEQKKLTFLSTEGDHLQFTLQWFIDHIIPYLKK